MLEFVACAIGLIRFLRVSNRRIALNFWFIFKIDLVSKALIDENVFFDRNRSIEGVFLDALMMRVQQVLRTAFRLQMNASLLQFFPVQLVFFPVQLVVVAFLALLELLLHEI